MKIKFLFSLFFMGMISISNSLYAQELSLQEIITGEKDTRAEEKNLKFQTYFFEALKQKAINKYSKAIENLEKCNEYEPENLAVYFEFSKNYLLLKKYYEADVFIDKALKIEPENSHLLKHKVAIYKRQQNFEEAIEIQKKLISLNPKCSDELVLLYIQNRAYKMAEKLIIEIEDNGLKSSKIKAYKSFLEGRKNSIDTSGNSSVINLNKGDLESLIKLFEKNKDYKTLKLLLTKALENLNFEMLFNESKNGLELYPAQPFLYEMNGIALNKLMKYNEAIAVLTIGIDFVVDNTEMEANYYEQLSISYKGLKKNEEALKYKLKAAQLRQNN